MRKFQRATFGLLLLAASSIMTLAQPATPEEAAKVVAREFGDKFKPLKQIPPLTLDIDNDGTADLVVAVTTQNPLTGEAEHNYRVIDPYSASFGFTDTRLMLAYPTEVEPRFLAIVHDWRAEKPKAKFVLANMPFVKLEIGNVHLKKKTFTTVENIDQAGVRGATYWDGKKYKWMPIGEDIPEFDQLETSKPQK